MGLKERMNWMPDRGDSVGASCNVCGKDYGYRYGEFDRPHADAVCGDCREDFLELDGEAKVHTIMRNCPLDLLEPLAAAGTNEDYVAIQDPQVSHIGMGKEIWICDRDKISDDNELVDPAPPGEVDLEMIESVIDRRES